MIEVPLGGERAAGRHAIVDDDQAWVLNYSWSVNNRGYVHARVNGRNQRLHALLLRPGPGLVTDHINHDKLDNRMANLRAITQAQNLQNTSAQRDSSSRFRGVYLHRPGKWVASGAGKYLGIFDDEKRAAAVAAAWRAEHMPFATN